MHVFNTRSFVRGRVWQLSFRPFLAHLIVGKSLGIFTGLRHIRENVHLTLHPLNPSLFHGLWSP